MDVDAVVLVGLLLLVSVDFRLIAIDVVLGWFSQSTAAIFEDELYTVTGDCCIGTADIAAVAAVTAVNGCILTGFNSNWPANNSISSILSWDNNERWIRRNCCKINWVLAGE